MRARVDRLTRAPAHLNAEQEWALTAWAVPQLRVSSYHKLAAFIPGAIKDSDLLPANEWLVTQGARLAIQRGLSAEDVIGRYAHYGAAERVRERLARLASRMGAERERGG